MSNNQLTLSDFIVQKVIGEGSYGRAVLCKQISNDKLVVIKEISLRKLTEQEQRDAWKETKVLSLLHHPNIITYYGCFLQNNILHIVMEYADNGDLSEEILKSLNNNQHFDEDKILNWFVQICLALKHLHDRKILHRDLKNQNIFLLKDNTAKLGDFGIAKMLSSTSQMSNTAIGTPYYLSPEICQGKSYNMKSDVWSLGCILYELCTLHHPFDSNCLNGLIIQIQRAKPPPIPYYYSSNLRNLVDKLLQKSPSKRPTVNQILELDFIRVRIPKFLSNTIEKKEFCHTILHDFKPGESPEKAKVTPEDVENNNANLMDKNNNNRGNRNRINSRGRNSRQGSYRGIPRYSSNRNIYPDNRRKINKNEDNDRSPRLQYRTNSSPQISQNQSPRYQQPQNKKIERNNVNNNFEIITDYEQQNEESAKEREANNYETDESSELNDANSYNDFNGASSPRDSNYTDNNYDDNDSYYSNQNVNYDNKSNNMKKNIQRKSVQRRTKAKKDYNYLNFNKESNYISAAEHLQAKKNAAVLVDRAMVRELREKKANEEKIIQQKNEEKRREVQEKAKAREIQRKEQMRRLKQEEKERQEKYKKLKPTFRIDRNVHYHTNDKTNPDSESNDSYLNSNSDIDYDEKRAERIKKRKEEEAKKENLKRNASVIADKIKQNPSNLENDQNSKKKREDNNIQALRDFLHQRRSEIRKNKQEDVIMIGNVKYYVGNNKNKNEEEDNDINLNQNEKQILKKGNKKEIENEVYGLIFDNYQSSEPIFDDDNNNLPLPPESNKDIIQENKVENNSCDNEDLLLTSDNYDNTNSISPEKETSPQNINENFANKNQNQNNSFNSPNTEESSYLVSSSESIEENKLSPSNSNITNSFASCSRRISFDSTSPPNINENPEVLDNLPQLKECSISEKENCNSSFKNENNNNDEDEEIIPNSPIKSKDSGYEYSPIRYNNSSETTPRSSIKSPNSEYDYSPLNKDKVQRKTVRFADSGYDYSPSNKNNKARSTSINPPNSEYDYSPNNSVKVQNKSAKFSDSGYDYSPVNKSYSLNPKLQNYSPEIEISSSNKTSIRSPNNDTYDYLQQNSNNRTKIQSNQGKATNIEYEYSPSNNNSNRIIQNRSNRSPNIEYEYSPTHNNSNTQIYSNNSTNNEHDYSPSATNNVTSAKVQANSNKDTELEYEYQSPINNSNPNVISNSIKSTDSGNGYSPVRYRINSNSNKTSNSECDIENSPLKDQSHSNPNQSTENEYKEEYSPVQTASINSNTNNNNNIIQGNSNGESISDCSPSNKKVQNDQIENDDLSPPTKFTDDIPSFKDEAANHNNTIIQQINKLLMDSLSTSGLNEEESQNSQIINKNEDEVHNQKTEINFLIKSENDNQISNDIENNLNLVDFNNGEIPLTNSFFKNNYYFTFRGNQLQFDNINVNDSLAYKIETVRKFIEDSLGVDKSIKAYRLAEANNFSGFKDVLTTPDQQSFYPLLLQLISSEEILLAKWLK